MRLMGRSRGHRGGSSALYSRVQSAGGQRVDLPNGDEVWSSTTQHPPAPYGRGALMRVIFEPMDAAATDPIAADSARAQPEQSRQGGRATRS